MALLTHEDIQSAPKIDLTDPNGQERATDLIAATVSAAEWSVGCVVE
jgi:hypothetical protein